MRIIKEIPTFFRSAKFIEPNTKLGKFLSELTKRINNEKDFINYISYIKFWDYPKTSLWAFEDVLNYVDELLKKYSNNNNEDINTNILIPLLNFLLLLIKSNYNNEIIASFDNLQAIYLTTFDLRIKIIIIEIHFYFVEAKKCMVHFYKTFYNTFHMFIILKNILVDLINNNFQINDSIYNSLEEILINTHKKWSNTLKQRKRRLSSEEQNKFQEISPLNLFKEIINNKKNYKKSENYCDKNQEEYLYFTQGYTNKLNFLEKIRKKESVMKYLLKKEIIYIITVNDFLNLVNEIVECSKDNKKEININITNNNNKILSIAKYILYSINLFIRHNQQVYEDEIVVSEYYIECYYNDVLKIVTSPKICIDLKSIFLKAGITFMTTFDGYDNILFQNGLFHSFLNDLTHQNGNDMEVLTLKDSNNQEFLNIILDFVFNFSIFKEIPLNFLSKILEIPKNNVYPYRIDNVIYSLKKKKFFDENILNQVIIPRLQYELQNLSVPSHELKYLYNNDNNTHDITINERNILIDRLYKIFIKILQKSTNLNIYGNFDEKLVNIFKYLFSNDNVLKNEEYIPSIINSIYFIIKVCNSFPSKIPNYINNNIFDLMIKYFTENFPKIDGSIHLVFLMLYTICIHNDGKKYIKDNLSKIKFLFENIFEKIQKDENYFYYNLFILKDLNKYELYSPYNALIHQEGINELIQIIFDNLEKYIGKIKEEITKVTIEKKENTFLNKELFLFESKRNFLNEFFISFNVKDIDLFENTLNIHIITLIKNYLEILLNTVSLYCLSAAYSTVNVIVTLAKKEPNFVMEELYNKFISLLNEKNKLKLNEVQKDKIFSTLQKIFEFTFNKIYQKVNERLDINKYSNLFTKLMKEAIINKTNLTCYISPINDRKLVINSNYYCKFLSTTINPQFREKLIRFTYNYLCKDLPHTTNPSIVIIDEDNYKNIKYPVKYNQSFRVEILSDSYFNSELLNAENKINNYFLTSVEYFCSLGKMIKAKGLYDVKEEDVECIRNYLRLSYILKELIKYFGKKYDINKKENEDEKINCILIYLSLFNMLNILLNGKNGKSISSIVIFYFIRYGGVRQILQIARNMLFFCKKEFTKGELPLMELLIIKNFWNLQVSLLLSIVKYSFVTHNGYFTILIREGELIKDFVNKNELDIYARYLILNDFIEVFFVNDDINYNASIIKDIEKNTSEFTKGIYIIFDTCCRLYQLYKDKNNNNINININEIHQKGFEIYEIIQSIQEGNKTTDEIINHLNECRKNDNQNLDICDDNKSEKNKKNPTDNNIDKDIQNINNTDNIIENNDKNMDNNDNKIIEDNNNNDNLNPNNDNSNNNNNEKEIRVVEEGFNNENRENKDKVGHIDIYNEVKKINLVLKKIQDIPLYPENDFIQDIKNIFKENNDDTSGKQSFYINKDNNFSFNKHRNQLYPFSKENYIKSLNFLCGIISHCSISYLKVNDMRKMNLEYRIKEFEEKNDLLSFLNVLVEKINNNKKIISDDKSNNNSIIAEEKYENELRYKQFMNYSILRYKTLSVNFYNNINISAYEEFISKKKLIANAILSIKEVVELSKNNYKNNNDDNKNKFCLKLIYENILTIYIVFCFLENSQKNFEEEKKMFLETFLFLLKESYNNQNISFINEPILILCLEVIIQFFNDSDNSLDVLYKFLNENNLLKLILYLKFNPEDANTGFYDNKFKFFVTVSECFKQFLHKIFSENIMYQHLLESICKYAIANIDCENYEVNFEDFIEMFVDFIKTENNKIFENIIKKLFNIIEKEIISEEKNKKAENEKKYYLRLKEEYQKEVDNIRFELNKHNRHKTKNSEQKSKRTKVSISSKKKDSHKSSKSSKKIKVKMVIEEKIKKTEKFWSERNKSLFYTLLKHIWKTSTLIGEDISKNKTYQIFSRNYIIDLDSSLVGLNCILHSYPSYLSLLLQFQNGKNHKISFIKYLIKYVFPLLNYYHYCISLPYHINGNEELENITLKEKKDVLRKYNNRANSFQSFFESFRYINIITSLMHSMTYRRRNMNDNECLLINECRKKILNEINIILSDIAHLKENEFIFLNKNDDLFPKNVVAYKSCIIVLFSMTEFIENSDIFSQLNPFEISQLLSGKDYDIIKNISIILKNMKISDKNEIFHEMGIKYLSQLFKFIPINQKSQKEKIKNFTEALNIKYKNIQIDENNKTSNKNDAIIDISDDEEEKEKKKEVNDNEKEKNEKKSKSKEDEMSIGYSENNDNESRESKDLILDDINEEGSGNEEGEVDEEEEEEEEEREGEEEEENEDNEEEDDYDDDEDEMMPEQILAQNNVEEDILSLMRSEEDDSFDDEENEDINDIESFHINNVNFQIIRNNDINSDNDNENFNRDALINRLEMALGMNGNNNQNNNNNNNNEIPNEINNDNIIVNNVQYNEENILFYNSFIDSSSNMNKTHIKSEINIFYEEFIIYPFLLLRSKSKNNLIYFDRPNISIDIFSNLDNSIVMKTSSVFLYYYLFPFDLSYERYFHFALIGTKEKTSIAYFEELKKIMDDYFSMYSFQDNKKLSLAMEDIKKHILENENIVIKKEIVNNIKNEKKEQKELIEKEEKEDKGDKKEKEEKEGQEKNIKKNTNDNEELNELLKEMPEDLRDSIEKEIEKNKNKKENENDKKNDNKDENQKKINDNNNNIDNSNKDNKEKKYTEINNNISKDNELISNGNKNDNNTNNNNGEIDIQFIMELPLDLREEILSTLDQSMVKHLSPELLNEYNRIMNKNHNEYILLEIPQENQNSNQINNYLNQDNSENNEVSLNKKHKKNGINLKKLKYKREDILANYNCINDDNNVLIKIFDDEFIENLIIFNIKTILSFRKKNNNNFNEYYLLINELILNENLRYKILDLLINTWICDSSCISNFSKNKIIPEKNSFLKNLYYLYIEQNLTEDYFFDDYEHFFINFATKYPKEMKKYFLKSFYNETGSYIIKNNSESDEKDKNVEYNITENSKNIKEILNIKYKAEENVLSKLISLTLLNSRSNIKTIFSIKIFTSVIKNCLKNINSDINSDDIINDKNNNNDNTRNTNAKNNELNINTETIEKIVDLFNTFETALFLSKGQRSNNPTPLLIELINDQKIYQILLDVVLKRIISIKDNITQEMDDFFKNKKIDITIFNKLLPEIILFKLIKLLSNINDDFNSQMNENEKTNSKKKKEKNKDNSKNSLAKKEMQNVLKKFIININGILFSCWEQLNNLLFDINNILKDSQDNLLPKLNRLIPYLETFITLAHLKFITTSSNINKSDNNPFIFEQKFISGKDSPKPVNLLKTLASKNIKDEFIEFFYEFCEKNKKIINYILRQYPKMFPNELIIKISSILDLENKQKYFRHCLKKLPASHNTLHIQVRRNGGELFSDSFEALFFRDAKDLRGKLLVSFENEEAVDAGGVKREWLTLLSKEMFNPDYMLFTLAKSGTTYTINSDSGKYNPEHLQQFKFIGKIMAKAIFDGMMIDCYFTRIIYKLICGTQISYHDMEDYDPVYYNSLKWLLENDFTEQETYLTYSYNHDNLGEIQTVDLIENGRNIEVTESNKFDYIQKLCSFKLYDTIKMQIDALLKGFFEIIPQNYISIFNHRELELVISGMPTIDIKDWKNNTIYENYTEVSPIIISFWEIIESFDNDERAEFLQFVTGSSKVPLEGFKALQGIGGINKFKITKVFDNNFDRLPTAHTCTNQLDLPDYPNKQILYERLTLAIREGKNSFGFI